MGDSTGQGSPKESFGLGFHTASIGWCRRLQLDGRAIPQAVDRLVAHHRLQAVHDCAAEGYYRVAVRKTGRWWGLGRIVPSVRNRTWRGDGQARGDGR